jgi:hypothetical protein
MLVAELKNFIKTYIIEQFMDDWPLSYSYVENWIKLVLN